MCVWLPQRLILNPPCFLSACALLSPGRRRKVACLSWYPFAPKLGLLCSIENRGGKREANHGTTRLTREGCTRGRRGGFQSHRRTLSGYGLRECICHD